MLKQISLLITLTACISTYAQKILYSNFIGYESGSPVFLQLIKEGSEVKPKVFQLIESSGDRKQLLDLSAYKMASAYQDGKVIAFDADGKIWIVQDGERKQLTVEEDEQKQKNFESGMKLSLGMMGVSNINFSMDGDHLYIPPLDKILRKYNLKTGSLTETEISALGLFSPVETESRIFYLTNNNNGEGFELNAYTKSNGNTFKLPILLDGGRVGLKFHPEGTSFLFIKNKKAYAYNLEVDRYQKITIPEVAPSRRFKIFDDFAQVYYSQALKEWRIVTSTNGELSSESLNISVNKESYTLTWDEATRLTPVDLSQVEEGYGKLATSGTFFIDLNEPINLDELEAGRDASGDIGINHVGFNYGIGSGSFGQKAYVTVCWPEGEGASIPSGQYQLKNMDDFYEDPEATRFVDISIQFRNDWFKLNQNSVGTVEISNNSGVDQLDLTFNVSGIADPYSDRQLNVSSAAKLRP